MANESDIRRLDGLYAGRRVFHGELHDHSDSGGTSDGKCPLAEWPGKMKALGMDFAAILDHRQVRHMYQPQWEDGLFIPGTEPGTTITDSKAEVKSVHYNILLPDRDLLAPLVESFPEYEFSGGVEGHFKYPTFTRQRFRELIAAVRARGGLFVHPHPKQLMKSDDPLDYWFDDFTGLEVFYISHDSGETKENYKLWTDLLAAGKKVWPTAGCDLHSEPRDTALTTFYAEEKSARSYLSHLSKGDLTCGFAGVQAAVGDTLMGGVGGFAGQSFIARIGDFHPHAVIEGHEYRADVIDDGGVVMSEKITPGKALYMSCEAKDRAFYRVEVTDETSGFRVAVASPVWNGESGGRTA